MQEWWPLLAVFWALYLIDGVQISRREKLFFWAATGRPRARVVQSNWFALIPFPTAWSVACEDLPVSLDSQGLTNWPSASAGRPPPLPDALRTWRWEDIHSVESRFGSIYINRTRFAHATPALDAAELRRLASQLKGLDQESRCRLLDVWQTERLRPLRLRRRLQVILGRSKAVAWLNSVQCGLLITITAFVLTKPVSVLPVAFANFVGANLSSLLIAYAFLHLVSIVWWYRLHSRFLPEAASERFGQVLMGLMLPPQALHVRNQLVQSLSRAHHPAAVALAVATNSAGARLLRNIWADIRWPLRPTGLPRDAGAIASASAFRMDRALLAAARRSNRGMFPEGLLKPPHRPSGACAWCPRCGDVFIRTDARCTHGIPLETWDERPAIQVAERTRP